MSSKLAPPDISLKAIARLAGPIFVANLAIIGSGTIDTIMAGNLGKEHLAAAALGIASTISVLMGLVGVLQGLSPIAGHHYGARRFELIGQELNQSLWLVAALALIGMPVLLWTDLWVSLGEAQGEVARMAAVYISWTALALPGSMAARAFISLNAAVSRPRVTMWVSIGMLVLKAPLNAVFMYGLFGLPAMGGAGAGVSFFILTYLSLAAYALIWRFDPFYKRMHAERLHWPQWHRLKEHLHIGIPIGLSTFFEVSSFTFMAIFVSRFGPATLSAHQIVSNLTTICYMFPLSIGIASSVLISQSLGAQWPSLGVHVLRRCFALGTVIALCASLVLYFGRGPLIWLYTNEASVHDLAADLLLFGCAYHVFDALQTISAFSLRGYRVTTLPMIIFGVMLWGVGLGMGYQMAFHGEWAGGPYQAYGFWGMTAVGLFLTGVSLSTMAAWVAHHFAKEDAHNRAAISAAAHGVRPNTDGS